MASNSTRKMYVNFAVREVSRSIMFFTKLGFTFNPEFTDNQSACMVINPDACVMLMNESFFKTFMKRDLCNTASHGEGYIALACRSRVEVHDLVNRAIQAGGRPTMDAKDRGFLYEWVFYDLDGHQWELLWVKPTGTVM